MARTFRPVKEVWGEASDQFVDHDVLLNILKEIATEAVSEDGDEGLNYQVDDYGACSVFYVAEGKAFLDGIRSLDGSKFDGHGQPLGDEENEALDEPARALVHNLKTMADRWEKESLGTDGSLRFYID